MTFAELKQIIGEEEYKEILKKIEDDLTDNSEGGLQNIQEDSEKQDKK